MEMLEIFAYRTVAVVHFIDQKWIPKTVIVSGVWSAKSVLPTGTQKWSLLTILNFSKLTDRHNGILMFLLLLVAETTRILY